MERQPGAKWRDEMSDLDYQKRRDCWLLWIIELGAFVAIVGIAAVAYTVSP